ncbi:MAG: TIGR04282 family arsenosugar biosynthesis glycosyltransferase [Halomonas subglaciescola]|nr:TIGR04282 family arsenosugar biosynthesis glycosyltransferase [Halomonas subglaciescola]
MPADNAAAFEPPLELHLLAKAPLAGRAKTRLMPRLGAQGAASAHAELVTQCVANACRALPAAHVTLWTALDHAHPLFAALQARFGIQLAPQPDGDLGTRIRHALTGSAGPAMIMGSDCPSITPALIATCAAQLASHPVVILPAEDGGYGLIGIHSIPPADTQALFADIPWGSGDVLATTRERLSTLKLDAAFPATVWDVDRPADWQRFQHERRQRHLQRDDASLTLRRRLS